MKLIQKSPLFTPVFATMLVVSAGTVFGQSNQLVRAYPFITQVEPLTKFLGATTLDNTLAPRSYFAITLGSGGALGAQSANYSAKDRTGIDAIFNQGGITATMCGEPVWLIFNSGVLRDGSGYIYGVVPITDPHIESCKLVVQAWFGDGSTLSSQPFTVKLAPHADQAFVFKDGNILLPFIIPTPASDLSARMTVHNSINAGSTVTVLGSGCGPATGLTEYFNNLRALATDKPTASIDGTPVEVLSAGFVAGSQGLCEYSVKIPTSVHGTASMMLGSSGPYTLFVK